jgi:hypothetical protein
VVAHTCNSRYLGGGDKKDHDSRPAWAKVSETPSQPMVGYNGTHLSSPVTWGSTNRKISLGWPEHEERHYFKNNHNQQQEQKRAGRMAQVIACLPHKCQALNSNPETTKKTKKGTKHCILLTFPFIKPCKHFSSFGSAGDQITILNMLSQCSATKLYLQSYILLFCFVLFCWRSVEADLNLKILLS